MENNLEFVIIVASLYLGVGLVFWLHSLRSFNPTLVRSHFSTLVSPWNYAAALVISFLAVVFVWPYFCLDRF